MRTLGVLLATLAFVGAASAARTATVNVGDSTLNPARVRVDAGGTVTWRNTGARSHRIASATSAFAAFTLAPRARRSVRFARNGANRYTVDGRRCGIVYVGVRLGPACAAGGGSGSSTGSRRPPQGTRTYRYNVSVRGEISNESPLYEFEHWSRKRSWTSTFVNVPVSVVATGSTFVGSASGLARTGTRLTERWRWFSAPIGGSAGVNCDGDATVSAPNFSVFASVRNGRTNLDVSTTGAVPQEVFDRIAADCSGRQPFEYLVPEFTRAGLTVRGSASPPGFRFFRETGGLARPAAELATGRAFRLDTGTVKIVDEARGITISQRYVLSFTPRR